jgi:hypothetical protein
MRSCQKRQQASLALNLQVFAGRRDFNTVTSFTRQAIGGAEDLYWTDQIEFVDRGDG